MNESRHQQDGDDSRNSEEPPASSDQRSPAEDRPPAAPVKPWQVVMSTLAAGFGVQSSRNRERDFKQGKAGTFIAAGLIFTVLFIAVVVTIVKVVLSTAG